MLPETRKAVNLAETAPTEQLRKRENIECASLGCRVRKIFHRIHEAERRGSIALVEIARNDRARPATNARQIRTRTVCCPGRARLSAAR